MLAITDEIKTSQKRMLATEFEGRCGRNAAVVNLDEVSDKMEATDLEANPEGTEAAVKRQEIGNEEMIVDSVGSLEDRPWIKAWLYGTADV
jgi:hypothetical protein